MTDGAAAQWRQQFLEGGRTATGFNLGTFPDFMTKLKESFEEYDKEGDTLENMRTMKMKRGEVNDRTGRDAEVLPAGAR